MEYSTSAGYHLEVLQLKGKGVLDISILDFTLLGHTVFLFRSCFITQVYVKFLLHWVTLQWVFGCVLFVVFLKTDTILSSCIAL